MDIERFKKEHAELMALVTALREVVQQGVGEHAEAIHRQLMAITSVIKLHLAAEDRMLYPAMLKASDAEVAQTARQFQEEMGGLATAYLAFAARWNLTVAIAANPQAFKDDANEVFKALHQRVQRENRELYPLAERL